jgi:putative heme-binding domain-containing protein
LDTPNGTERDRIHQELVFAEPPRSRDKKEIELLEKLALSSKRAAVRLQALCVLEGWHALRSEPIVRAMSDADPNVRANAVRLSEPHKFFVENALLGLVHDSDNRVRFQLALSFGERDEAWASYGLGMLAARDAGDPWMRAAILSSATNETALILRGVLALDSKQPGRTELIRQLIATAVGAGDSDSLMKIASEIAPSDIGNLETWQLGAFNGLLDALDRKKISLPSLAQNTVEFRPVLAHLTLLFDWSRKLAAESDRKDAIREPAIHLLGRDPQKQSDDLKLLANLLEQPLSTPLQSAVFDSLKRLRGPEAPGVLLAGWKQRAPSLRQSTIDVLLSRDDWMNALLDSIENGTVSANEISPANRQRLLKHSNHALQKRAEAIWSGQTGSRAEIIAKYQSATTLTGDGAKGAAVFANACATCHFLRGQGHAVGPNLAALADKTLMDFLTAILDPNAVVEPRFVAYNIETKDGRSLSGIVSAETATTLTLVQGGGGQETVLRSDIQEMRASGLSLMPEGLEQNMTPQDLANLIAYLKTSPRPFGTASAEQAEQSKRYFLSTGCNGLGKILAAADRLPYPSWLGTLPMPFCRQSQDQSRLAWQTMPVPADLNSNAIYQFRLAAGMGFISQPSGKFKLRLNDKPMLEFNVATTDQSWQSADGRIKMIYTVMENNAEDSNGVLLIEVANALLVPGKPANFEVIGSSSNSQRWFGLYIITPAMARATQ